MSNLLAQRKEIKRLEKVASRRREEEEDQRARDEEETRQRAVAEFEAVQMGLEVKIGRGGKVIGREKGKVLIEQDAGDETKSLGSSEPSSRGQKRKFEIDEEELKRIALEERSRAKLALEEEKQAAKPHLPSFWVPGKTPDQNYAREDTSKQNPICPASSSASPHALSLKTLVSVHFNTEKSSQTDKDKAAITCPSCNKTLTNSTKAMLAIPCGHVLCKPCVDRFMKPDLRHHRDAHDDGPEPESIHCYVCDADLSGATGKGKDKDGKKSKKDKDKGVKPGLVEIRSEGTGFASGGKAVVKRDGVAFQV